MPDYVIRIESVGAPSYVDESIEGDPGRTTDISKAERYETENLVIEVLATLRSKYPNRRYCSVQLDDALIAGAARAVRNDNNGQT